MGKLAARASRTMLAGAIAVTLAGCGGTVTGTAIKAPLAADDPDASVALMKTGPYPTAAGTPFGTTGDNPARQSQIESMRLAEYTSGPWEVDQAVRDWPGFLATGQIGVQTSDNLPSAGIFTEPMIAAVRTHGYIAGFSTLRTTPQNEKQNRVLFNYVMEFPTPEAATAAADELTAVTPPPFGAVDPAGRPADRIDSPGARAKVFDLPDGVTRAESFTAYGQFVFYQSAQVSDLFFGASAENLLDALITRQQRRIDEFKPTPPDKMASLPMDPTGNLLARTLWAPDNRSPANLGAWAPRAWLHFEADPVATSTVFAETGVSAVSQRLATIFEAKSAESAKAITEGSTTSLSNDPMFKAVDGVPGLPRASCFERVSGELVPPTASMTIRRVAWHFRCFAWADRYAYTTFSDTADDARQQMAAQYRILAGE
ncbi:hypothetical protein [Mycobacterium sp. GA-2829]|uniref:DUF7373 family lipoprotein n=1 Tax=Mycobacterium sp. GA-2829 TaxID=1772283 RepID=UPI000740564B|nr:hypothetical protein [Mycobacterium sp. GA-2829]KUI34197.1 hypothetical protein AU194_17760 [Mycobacterium sp. GA-2829]